MQTRTNAALEEEACAVQLVPVNYLGAGEPTGPLLVTASAETLLATEDLTALLAVDDGASILKEE